MDKQSTNDKSNEMCCKPWGDVRGMCFTCAGDLTKIDGDKLKRVRECESKNYAIAFWIWNNHNYEYNRYGLNILNMFKNMKGITQLNPDWSIITKYILSFDSDSDSDDEKEE